MFAPAPLLAACLLAPCLAAGCTWPARPPGVPQADRPEPVQQEPDEPEPDPPEYVPPPQAPVEIAGGAEDRFHEGRVYYAGDVITFTLTGPEILSETAPVDADSRTARNPFTDYEFYARFQGRDPSGQSIPSGMTESWGMTVPGYFAADGDAANTGATAGNKWRVHVRPPYPWRIRYSLYLRNRRTGEPVARASGNLHIAPPRTGDDSYQTLRARQELPLPDDLPPGRAPALVPFPPRATLRAESGRLKFVSPYPDNWGDRLESELFTLTGVGRSANLLEHPDFDAAPGDPPGPADPHVGDWRDGDPTWGAPGVEPGGKGVIGALNYLAEAGANGLSLTPFEIGGDKPGTTPHAGPDDRTRWDCSKLDRWEIAFSHAERLGFALNVRLPNGDAPFERRDAEIKIPGLDGIGSNPYRPFDLARVAMPGADHRNEAGEYQFQPVPPDTAFADTRKLFYRELIARFGHHATLVWHVDEERPPQVGPADRDAASARLAVCTRYVQAIDRHEHPIVLHPVPGGRGAAEEVFKTVSFDGLALTADSPAGAHARTLERRTPTRYGEHPPERFVLLDQAGPAGAGLPPDEADGGASAQRAGRRALWATVFLDGSGAEWRLAGTGAGASAPPDYRRWASVWRFSKIAREFARREGLYRHTSTGYDRYTPGPAVTDADGGPLAGAFAASRDRRIWDPKQTGYGTRLYQTNATLVYLPAGTSPRLTVPREPPPQSTAWTLGRSRDSPPPPDPPPGPRPVRWFDVEAGGDWQIGSKKTVPGGATTDLGAPPGGDRSRDWIVKIGG